jgi:hypothetical protein
LKKPCLWRKLPEASKRFATTGEEVPPMVTGGIKERRTGFGILRDKVGIRVYQRVGNMGKEEKGC